MALKETMAETKRCETCIYYLKSINYCLKLMSIVNDPGAPPCMAPEKEAEVGIEKLKTPMSLLEEAPSYKLDLDSVAPTGIKGLDTVLGGGFLRGKTYLVAGETGAGKTIFSMQFLITGALNGEPGVYLAIDEPAEHVLKGLRRFGWGIVDDLIKRKKLLFLDMRTHFSKIYLKDERRKIEPRFVIEQILKNVERVNAKRLVIDPIAPLIYGWDVDVLYTREFLREMVFALEKRGSITTIMTSEVPTGSNRLSRFGVEEFLATGILVLGLEEIKGSIHRVLYVRKARWAPVKPQKYIFEIVPAKGIVIIGRYEDYL